VAAMAPQPIAKAYFEDCAFKNTAVDFICKYIKIIFFLFLKNYFLYYHIKISKNIKKILILN
jgi:hypothetical protein